ncbi:hypothetical protein RJJ65_30685 [Rhizobium hidalgonense]|uniref:Uncharacterized protein n=1 Tax=Rhizobium hidalgonense TaxID=1538159 RepID=A0AAJ2LQM6_9HYPH|nr:hypothetical protein [Rhizobium hidalgonense]MDR9776939.1 hypothetical protein [Rhizobium hidalgonense]MDR9814007.1 hypothetical protein [Rhizobium hidalgonense]MDR9820673.1 hypothetical protein [Rhizobium hidalgonense]
MMEPVSKEDARLCAGVVKEVARAKGIVNDPAAIGGPDDNRCQAFQ